MVVKGLYFKIFVYIVFIEKIKFRNLGVGGLYVLVLDECYIFNLESFLRLLLFDYLFLEMGKLKFEDLFELYGIIWRLIFRFFGLFSVFLFFDL